jgi:hypothetical protein
MIEPSLQSERPAVSVEATLASIREAIDNLRKEREWIVTSYAAKILDLEDSRDMELAKNLEGLKSLGVSEDSIPFRLTAGKKFRKLTHDEILHRLQRFMQPNDSYPSPVLLAELKISYPDFRTFVKTHGDFIDAVGVNKGRVYRRKQV